MRYDSKLNQRLRFVAYSAANIQQWINKCKCGYDKVQIAKKTERLEFWLKKYRIVS